MCNFSLILLLNFLYRGIWILWRTIMRSSHALILKLLSKLSFIFSLGILMVEILKIYPWIQYLVKMTVMRVGMLQRAMDISQRSWNVFLLLRFLLKYWFGFLLGLFLLNFEMGQSGLELHKCYWKWNWGIS